MPSRPTPPHVPRSRPSPSRPPSSRPGGSRSSGALLDPYGIYGTRTATRLRDSRRRRRSQSFVLILVLAALAALAVAAVKVRRIGSEPLLARHELALPMATPPLWIEAVPQTTAASGSAQGVLLVAGEDGRLLQTELTQTTGETRKTLLLETDFPLHAPLVFEETAFVPCEDGVLYAVSWRERKLLWRRRFDAALTSQPAILIINKKPVVFAGSDAGLLLALDAATGKTVWQARLPAPLGSGLATIPASQTATDAGTARILIPLLGGAAMRGGLWCLEGATGKILWRFPADARIEATQLAAPVVDEENGKIYAGNDTGAVFCLDLQTGKYNSPTSPGWKTFLKSLENHDQSQAVLVRAAPLLTGADANGNRSVIVGGNDGGVRCLGSDGKVRWVWDAGAPVSSLALVRGADGRESVLVCSRSTQLVLLDAANGAAIKGFSSDGDHFVGVALKSPTLFTATNQGAILQFALSQ